MFLGMIIQAQRKDSFFKLEYCSLWTSNDIIVRFRQVVPVPPMDGLWPYFPRFYIYIYIYIYREHIEVHSGFITQESNGNRISTQLREGSLKKLTTNKIFCHEFVSRSDGRITLFPTLMKNKAHWGHYNLILTTYNIDFASVFSPILQVVEVFLFFQTSKLNPL